VVKDQFSSPVTPANFCAGYVCTDNTLIWLVGICGKTCSVAIEQVLPGMSANQMRVLQVFTANASQKMRALPVHG